MFHASGQLEEAREHYRQAYCASLRERAPNFDLILLVLGEMVQLHFDRQDYQRAKPLLKRMLQWARLGRAGQAQVGKIVLKLEFAQAQMRGGASDCGTTQKTTPIQLDHSAPIHSQL